MMRQSDILTAIEPPQTNIAFSNGYHIEQLLGEDMKGNPTYIGQTLKKITDILNKNDVEFALAGALSLGVRCKPRYTTDIDLLVHPDNYKTLEKLLEASGMLMLLNDEYMLTVKDVATGVEVDLLFSPFDPEESGRVTATREELFGINVPVIQSEYLLWMYLLSDQEKHRVDGMNLIKSGGVNLEKLITYLDYDEDEESANKLIQWIFKAREESSGSYSKSVRRRKLPKDK